MHFSKLFSEEILERKKKYISIIGFLLYISMVFTLRRVSNDMTAGLVYFKGLDLYSLRGMLTQIQLLILIYMVLTLGEGGYRLAMALNIFAIGSASSYMYQAHNLDAIPGVMTNLLAMMILTLVIQCKNQAEVFIKKIEDQKEQLIESRDALYHQAHYDYLTRLPNRMYGIELLEKSIDESPEKDSVGVAFIDLDGFKEINDQLGHDVGDELLIEIGRRLRSLHNNHMIVARSGGDEFIAIIHTEKGKEGIQEVIEAIHSIFDEAFLCKDTELHLSSSVGVSVHSVDAEIPGDLIKKADMAMYEAKKRGGGQYVFYCE